MDEKNEQEEGSKNQEHSENNFLISPPVESLKMAPTLLSNELLSFAIDEVLHRSILDPEDNADEWRSFQLALRSCANGEKISVVQAAEVNHVPVLHLQPLAAAVQNLLDDEKFGVKYEKAKRLEEEKEKRQQRINRQKKAANDGMLGQKTRCGFSLMAQKHLKKRERSQCEEPKKLRLTQTQSDQPHKNRLKEKKAVKRSKTIENEHNNRVDRSEVFPNKKTKPSTDIQGVGRCENLESQLSKENWNLYDGDEKCSSKNAISSSYTLIERTSLDDLPAKKDECERKVSNKKKSESFGETLNLKESPQNRATDARKYFFALFRKKHGYVGIGKHWMNYPRVIEGAVAYALHNCNFLERAQKISSALNDLFMSYDNVSMTSKGKVCGISPSTFQLYHHRTRIILADVLGVVEIDERLRPYLHPTVTVDELFEKLSAFRTAGNFLCENLREEGSMVATINKTSKTSAAKTTAAAAKSVATTICTEKTVQQSTVVKSTIAADDDIKDRDGCEMTAGRLLTPEKRKEVERWLRHSYELSTDTNESVEKSDKQEDNNFTPPQSPSVMNVSGMSSVLKRRKVAPTRFASEDFSSTASVKQAANKQQKLQLQNDKEQKNLNGDNSKKGLNDSDIPETNRSRITRSALVVADKKRFRGIEQNYSHERIKNAINKAIANAGLRTEAAEWSEAIQMVLYDADITVHTAVTKMGVMSITKRKLMDMLDVVQEILSEDADLCTEQNGEAKGHKSEDNVGENKRQLPKSSKQLNNSNSLVQTPKEQRDSSSSKKATNQQNKSVDLGKNLPHKEAVNTNTKEKEDKNDNNMDISACDDQQIKNKNVVKNVKVEQGARNQDELNKKEKKIEDKGKNLTNNEEISLKESENKENGLDKANGLDIYADARPVDNDDEIEDEEDECDDDEEEEFEMSESQLVSADSNGDTKKSSSFNAPTTSKTLDASGIIRSSKPDGRLKEFRRQKHLFRALHSANDKQNDSNKEQRKPRRRRRMKKPMPPFWRKYPLVVKGVMETILRRCVDKDLHDQLIIALDEFIFGDTSIPDVTEKHHVVLTTFRRYLIMLRDALEEVLGAKELCPLLTGYLTPTTSFADFKEYFSKNGDKIRAMNAKQVAEVNAALYKPNDSFNASKKILIGGFDFDGEDTMETDDKSPATTSNALPQFLLNVGKQNKQDAVNKTGSNMENSPSPFSALTSRANMKRRHFSGTVAQLCEEIKSILKNRHTGDLDALAALVTGAITKEIHLRSAMQAAGITLDLLLAAYGFCGRQIALDRVEITDLNYSLSDFVNSTASDKNRVDNQVNAEPLAKKAKTSASGDDEHNNIKRNRNSLSIKAEIAEEQRPTCSSDEPSSLDIVSRQLVIAFTADKPEARLKAVIDYVISKCYKRAADDKTRLASCLEAVLIDGLSLQSALSEFPQLRRVIAMDYSQRCKKVYEYFSTNFRDLINKITAVKPKKLKSAAVISEFLSDDDARLLQDFLNDLQKLDGVVSMELATQLAKCGAHAKLQAFGSSSSLKLPESSWTEWMSTVGVLTNIDTTND